MAIGVYWNQLAVYILSKEERESRRVTPAFLSIKKSQAILWHFIDVKFSVCLLGSENRDHVLWHLELFPASSFLFPLSSFLFPLSSFLFPDLSRKDRSDSASRADCRSFSVLTILTDSRPEKSPIESQNMVSFSEPSVNQTLDLRSIKHFRIAWLFLIDIR